MRGEGLAAGEKSAEWAEKEMKARELYAQANKLIIDEAVKAEKAAADQSKKLNEERDKAAEKMIEQKDKLAKLRFDALSTDEKITKLEADRVKLLEIIRDGKKEHKDVTAEEIQLIETTNELTKQRGDREKITKATLDGQFAQLQQQNVSREQMITVLRQQGFAEDDILKKLKAQNEELRIGFQIRGRYDDQLSDLALQDKASTLKQSIFAREQNLRMQVNGYDPMLGWEKAELERVQKEQQARSKIRKDVANFGEDYAANFYKGNIPEFERLLDYLKGQPEPKQQINLLTEINQRLKKVLTL